MDRSALVPVITVQNPMQAEIIRGALLSAGIPCQLGGETQGGFVGVAALPIDVMTAGADVSKARKELRRLRKRRVLLKRRRAEARKLRVEEAARLEHAFQESKPPSQHIQTPPE